MKKAAATTANAAAKYALNESSMVVVDHLQFQSSFLNRWIGKVRTQASLNNIGATFLDFRQKEFPE